MEVYLTSKNKTYWTSLIVYDVYKSDPIKVTPGDNLSYTYDLLIHVPFIEVEHHAQFIFPQKGNYSQYMVYLSPFKSNTIDLNVI